MIIETLPIISPFDLKGEDGTATAYLTKPFLAKLAKAITSSIRIDVGTNQLTFYGHKSISDDVICGVKGTNGLSNYSTSGQVTNIRRNNVFIGYTTFASTVGLGSPLPLADAKTHLEEYINKVEPDLQTYRVFRFQSEALDKTFTEAQQKYRVRWVYFVIGLVSQNQTDYYTPFSGITETAETKYTVLDPTYLGNLDKFFIAGTDVPGNINVSVDDISSMINTAPNYSGSLGSVSRDMSHRFKNLPVGKQKEIVESALDLQNKLNNL